MPFPKGEKKISRNKSSLSLSSATPALTGHFSQIFHLLLFVMVNCDKNEPLPLFFTFNEF